MFLDMSSRMCYFITSPGMKERQADLYFPGMYITFLKINMTLAFLQSLGTSFSHHYQSITTRSGLIMQSVSSPSTHECIPPGPMDLHMSS